MSTELDMTLPFGGADKHKCSEDAQRPVERLVMLPCPFCGAEPVVDNGFSPMESIYYAWCSNKECELSPLGRDERLFSIVWWNTRAT